MNIDELIVATERIADAEATADRQKKLVVREHHSQGRYDPGRIHATHKD
jgi:hypothetical protein